MKKIRVQRYTALLVLTGLLCLMVTVTSANGTTYSVRRWVVAGGGGESQGGGYVLRATAGRAEAGRLSGGSYVLGSGYWHGAVTSESSVYLPVVLRE